MNPWLSFAKVSRGGPVNLFCFPFAGGGASFYRSRVPLAPPSVALCGVQLPGREERMGETPCTSMPALVAAAADALLPELGAPFALFGHSMGALVAYELAQELRKRGAPAPRHLFASGSPAPHIPDQEPVHELPEAGFLAAIRRYGGLPAEVLESPDLLRLLLPRMRADLTVTGAYTFPGHPPLDCPVTVFTGSTDAVVPVEDAEAWREHTTGPFSLQVFEGGHFFIADHAREIFTHIGREVGPPGR